MTLHCYHCHSANIEYKFPVRDSFLYQCEGCELGFLHPPPKSLELTHLPPGQTPLESISHPLRPATIEHYLEELVAYTQTSDLHLLEIGWGEEDFSHVAKNQGMQVTRLTLQRSEQNSLDHCLDEIDWDALGSFDGCIVVHVLERLSDPQKLLTQIRKVLKDQGVLFLSTISLDSRSARFWKGQWMEFKPQHLFYFNTQNLESFLIKAGFTQFMTTPSYRMLRWEELPQHLKHYRVPVVPWLMKVCQRLVPQYFRQKLFPIGASGVNVLCRKSDLPSSKPMLSIIMPVFNEKATFATTMEAVLNKQVEGLNKEIVIVESNSTDGTREEVAQYENHKDVRVIYEERPRGKGHAVRSTFPKVHGDIILIQDADTEYDVNDYDVLLEPVMKYQRLFVLGSRHTGNWKMRSFENRFLLSSYFNFGQVLFTWMINVLCGSKLNDPFTMYKIFHRECLYGIHFEANRFDLDWEIVVKFLRKRYFPLEIPVNYKSRSHAEGKKVTMVMDPLVCIKTLFKSRFGKLKELP